MMEFVLNILLNYITLGVAGVAFILLPAGCPDPAVIETTMTKTK